MASHLATPPAKRRLSVSTLIVHDDPFSIKGLESSLFDLRCYICLGWDRGEMSRLACNALCGYRAYCCTSHASDPLFDTRCVACKLPATVQPDPTATALLTRTALQQCTSPQCPELVTMEDMQAHLLFKCPFNLMTCPNPGCAVR